jgi:hypothetical protein
MAIVRSLTADRMLAIEAASVIDGDISGDNLILTTKGGKQINAGNVRGPEGPPGPGMVVGASMRLGLGVVSTPVGATILPYIGNFMQWGDRLLLFENSLIVRDTGWYRISFSGHFQSSATGTIRMFAVSHTIDSVLSEMGDTRIGCVTSPLDNTDETLLPEGHDPSFHFMSGSGFCYLESGTPIVLKARQDSGDDLYAEARLNVERLPV